MKVSIFASYIILFAAAPVFAESDFPKISKGNVSIYGSESSTQRHFKLGERPLVEGATDIAKIPIFRFQQNCGSELLATLKEWDQSGIREGTLKDAINRYRKAADLEREPELSVDVTFHQSVAGAEKDGSLRFRPGYSIYPVAFDITFEGIRVSNGAGFHPSESSRRRFSKNGRRDVCEFHHIDNPDVYLAELETKIRIETQGLLQRKELIQAEQERKKLSPNNDRLEKADFSGITDETLSSDSAQ